MKNNDTINIPIPKLTWKLIIAIILIILASKIDPNNAFEILKELIERVKN